MIVTLDKAVFALSVALVIVLSGFIYCDKSLLNDFHIDL